MGSPRILVLDDDHLILQMVKDALVADGFDIVTTATPADAMGMAVSAQPSFDLIIADVNMKGTHGFTFRTDLRQMPAYAQTPFLFFSAADPAVEVHIAEKLGSDRLLLKPASAADIRRAVYVGLKKARVERGELPEALARIFERITTDRETGVFTAVSGTTVKRVVFQDGRIAFAGSNDPRDLIGQVFVKAGLISEKDLAEAFAYRDATAVAGKKPPLGVVLTALRKVTPEQCEKVFEKKIRETVLEIFLWKAGTAEFMAGGLQEADKAFPIALDSRLLLAEGRKRRTRWIEVQKILPNPGVRFERVGQAWPKGFPANAGDKVLAKHIEAGRTMAEILVELRGQDYAVGVRLSELVKNSTIKAVAATGFSGATFHESVSIDIDEALASMEMEESMSNSHVEVARNADPGAATRNLGNGGGEMGLEDFDAPPPLPSGPIPPAGADVVDLPMDTLEPLAESLEPLPTDPTPPPLPPVANLPNPVTIGLLTRALVLLRAGDLPGAREGLVAVLAADPMNGLARQRLGEVEQSLSQQGSSSGLPASQKVKLGIQIHELVGRAIPPNDAFLLSRLAAGAMSITDLAQICPMPELEIRQCLEGYLANGVLKKVF